LTLADRRVYRNKRNDEAPGLKTSLKRVAHKVIRLPAIHGLNIGLIAILLVGVPAVTGISLGALRVSSDHWLGRLVMGGLALGVVVNGMVVIASRNRKERSVCLGWMLLHAAVLGVAWLAHLGWIEFGWLRDLLRRMAGWRQGR
jgi:hypothetical protein